MTIENYMDVAKGAGYFIQFGDLGTAYVKLDNLYITGALEVKQAELKLAMLGMAIIFDDMHKMEL